MWIFCFGGGGFVIDDIGTGKQKPPDKEV